MTPREIIAKGLFHAVLRFGQSECELYAGHAIQALHSAGYRILGPGEWDKETVEKCAEVAEKPHRFANGDECPLPSGLACATAIRAALEEKQG